MGPNPTGVLYLGSAPDCVTECATHVERQVCEFHVFELRCTCCLRVGVL